MAHSEQQRQQLATITDLLHQGSLAHSQLQQQLTQALFRRLASAGIAPATIAQLLPPPVPVAAVPRRPTTGR